MTSYYNEIDPYAAQWLRNLIEAGHIAPGVVDERSIEDVTPQDIEGFTQCHFFAGVGVWSLALRRAGWDDSRPVWTASCPCQPFSAAGAGSGFADARHLWPSLAWLIAECKPSVVIGEQVASKAVGPWVDFVHADLEALGYAFGAVPFPSAGVGAPHIRDRLYWVGHRLAHTHSELNNGGRVTGPRWGTEPADRRATVGLGDTFRQGLEERIGHTGVLSGTSGARAGKAIIGTGFYPGAGSAAAANGLWADADWLFCRDGKWRPVEPGTFPLVNGASSRVGRLRAYGNAINAQAARCFIECII